MKVEYCIHSIHEIDHFESVYHSLHKSGVKCNFVVTSSVSLKEPSRAQTIRSKLLERGLNCQNEADINADVVIGIHGACSLSNYNSFKIKFPYGFYMEKDNHHYAPRGINGYDAALCLGSLQQEYFERSLDSYRCRIIGVPRHDLFFNKAVGFG